MQTKQNFNKTNDELEEEISNKKEHNGKIIHFHKPLLNRLTNNKVSPSRAKEDKTKVVSINLCHSAGTDRTNKVHSSMSKAHDKYLKAN